MVAKMFCILLFAALCESKKSLVPKAIVHLVRSNNGERPALIEIFYNSRKVKILDETLKLLSREKKLKVTPIDMNDLSRLNEENCTTRENNEFCIEPIIKRAIFLFDTMENYQKFKGSFHVIISFKPEPNHLVYCEDASKENIQRIITPDTYESFLVVKNNKISLHMMTMYTEKMCRAEQLVEINQFSSLERKWKTDKFFMPRIENFYGCELRIEVDRYNGVQLPFVRVLKKADGTETAEGAIVDMFEALSTHLNFTATHFNGYDYDVSVGAEAQSYFLFGTGHSSDPIYTSSDIIAVPPGELYTSWEKLFLPFDWPTWMSLGITFAIAFLVIRLIIVSKSTSLYGLVIGSNVSTPSLNVIAIFMGIGQILLPQRNVTRFLFMIFVLFSLIMRTAYQGKYFEFLTSDMRRKPIQTVEELKDNNFTFIMNRLNLDSSLIVDFMEKG